MPRQLNYLFNALVQCGFSGLPQRMNLPIYENMCAGSHKVSVANIAGCLVILLVVTIHTALQQGSVVINDATSQCGFRSGRTWLQVRTRCWFCRTWAGLTQATVPARLGLDLPNAGLRASFHFAAVSRLVLVLVSLTKTVQFSLAKVFVQVIVNETVP